MKRSILLFAAIAMMVGFSGKVMGQATENTAAGAKLITPISISETSALHFGTMSVKTGTGGTCVLSTQGVRTQTGGVDLSSQTPAATNAAYSVSGQAATTYAITLPETITVTETVGETETMSIGSLLARTASAGADGLTGTLSDPAGTDTFTVGGTLTVPLAQLAGVYAGTFDVTVAYN